MPRVGHRNFQASDGWLNRWEKCNSISFTVVSGENKSDTNIDEDSDNSEVCDELQPPPSIKEVQSARDMMQRYSLYLESTDVAIQLTNVCSSIAQQNRPRLLISC